MPLGLGLGLEEDVRGREPDEVGEGGGDCVPVSEEVRVGVSVSEGVKDGVAVSEAVREGDKEGDPVSEGL